MTIPLKEIDSELREIEDLLAALIDATDDLLADPQEATANRMLDFGLLTIHHRVVALRTAIR